MLFNQTGRPDTIEHKLAPLYACGVPFKTVCILSLLLIYAVFVVHAIAQSCSVKNGNLHMRAAGNCTSVQSSAFTIFYSRHTHLPSAGHTATGSMRQAPADAGLGSALINPPAAKPPFSILRRCRAKIEITVFQYAFAQFLPCALQAEKIRLFADGGLMRANPKPSI